jgi:hypothetical protein
MSNRQPRRPHELSTTQRGFGRDHQKRRQEVKRLVDAGVMRCGRCGERILPGTKFHLDHEDIVGAHELGIYRKNPASHPWCKLAARNKRQAELARRAQGLPPVGTEEREKTHTAPAMDFFNVSRTTR